VSLVVAIRNFQHQDTDRVSEIVLNALGEYFPRSLYIEKSIDWPDGFKVALEGERIVAMLLGILQGKSESRIIIFAVDEHYRRRGIGRRLMEEFIDLSMRTGVSRITLEVRKSNTAAISFYEKFGFRITGVLMSYYADMEDGLRMMKELNHQT